MARERAVKEKREKKREKKQAAAEARAREAEGIFPEQDSTETDELPPKSADDAAAF
ncbi:MAG TPA: hypothetical protein VF895_05805 [Gaiellaceae bacterium]